MGEFVGFVCGGGGGYEVGLYFLKKVNMGTVVACYRR